MNAKDDHFAKGPFSSMIAGCFPSCKKTTVIRTALGITTIPTKQSHSTYSIFFATGTRFSSPDVYNPPPIEVGCTMNFHIIGPICLGPFGFQVWALVVYGPLTTPCGAYQPILCGVPGPATPKKRGRAGNLPSFPSKRKLSKDIHHGISW